MHAVQVPFERIHVRGPEPAKRSQPRVHLLKRLGFQPVETALRIHGRFHEASLAQDAQVLGYRRLRHTQLPLDLANRLFR